MSNSIITWAEMKLPQFDSRPASDTLSNLPEGASVQVPAGYALCPNGIYTPVLGPERVETHQLTAGPVLLIGRAVGAGGAHFLRIAWQRGEPWEIHVISRGDALTARGLERWIQFGLPFIPAKLEALSRYLAHFERLNFEALPRFDLAEGGRP